MQDFIADGRLAAGFTYEAFMEAIQRRLAQPLPADRSERKQHFYVKYNQARSEAVAGSFEPGPDLRAAMADVKQPQWWMLLTEDWCVDSAFALPIIARAAALNPLVTLRILPRDEHLDVMDQFLTNGARSIPLLVAFSETGEERFRWGPRPMDAAAYREQLVAEGLERSEISARLAQWLEAGGWRSIEPELAERVAMTVRSESLST